MKNEPTVSPIRFEDKFKHEKLKICDCNKCQESRNMLVNYKLRNGKPLSEILNQLESHKHGKASKIQR